MGIGGRLVGRSAGSAPRIMAAKLEARPIGRARRVDVEPGPRHREGEAVHEQGIDEEACGQPPPPLPCRALARASVTPPWGTLSAHLRRTQPKFDSGSHSKARLWFGGHAKSRQRDPPKAPAAQPSNRTWHPGLSNSADRPDSGLPGRGRARPCGQSASRHRLRRPLHLSGIHLAVPGDRPARLRHRRHRLPAAALPRRSRSRSSFTSTASAIMLFSMRTARSRSASGWSRCSSRAGSGSAAISTPAAACRSTCSGRPAACRARSGCRTRACGPRRGARNRRPLPFRAGARRSLIEHTAPVARITAAESATVAVRPAAARP